MESKSKVAFFGYYKLFSSFEEMIEYGRMWPYMKCQTEYFEKFLQDRLKEIKMNADANPHFTNKQAMLLLRMNTDDFA